MDAYLIVEEPAYAISDESHQPNRRSPNYHPTIWGEHFLAYVSDVKESFPKETQEHERLKEEVIRKVLIETPDESWQKLDLIDTIQRLGVSYHFESEIEESLRSIYEAYDHRDYDEQFKHEDGNELHTVAIRFRLLRQHGYNASCAVFNKFKDPDGNFKESLHSNIQGLLSLYEAANYRVHDEDILEEALNFTTSQLVSMLPNLNNFLAIKVNQALEMPIQKTLTRLGARQFMSLYQEDKSHDALLLNFAKFDFKILQKLHQEELSGITKWWKDLDCPKNSPFARDRVVECYFWILGVYFEPKYSFARTTMTKALALVSIFDDIHDVYGTSDELVLLADSIERWHISALDQLPSYMRPWYQALLDVYSEMEKGSSKACKTNPVMNYAISSMKTLLRAYHQEAKWMHSGHLPKYEEYMQVALDSSVYPMLATNSLVSMGDIVSEDALDWVANNPLILRASSVIARLMNDMVGYEAEKENGKFASAIECYMKQYGASKEEAFAEFEEQLTNAWKDTNKEWLVGPSSGVPKFVLERILNLTRVAYLMYREGDCYTNSSTIVKRIITLVLVDPIQI